MNALEAYQQFVFLPERILIGSKSCLIVSICACVCFQVEKGLTFYMSVTRKHFFFLDTKHKYLKRGGGADMSRGEVWQAIPKV